MTELERELKWEPLSRNEQLDLLGAMMSGWTIKSTSGFIFYVFKGEEIRYITDNSWEALVAMSALPFEDW